MRLAAIGDLHCKKASQGAFQSLFAAASAAADVLVLCGDLTDYGLAEEARILVKELAAVKSMPVVAVLGNHDYESNETDQVKSLLVDAGVHLLDGEACEIDGVGFAGAKGLGGGFGERALRAGCAAGCPSTTCACPCSSERRPIVRRSCSSTWSIYPSTVRAPRIPRSLPSTPRSDSSASSSP